MTFAKKLLALAAIIFSFATKSSAQGVVSGQEVLVSGSGTTISITPPNTSALNYSTPTGTNTFIIPLTNPTVSIRIYVTNNTANACPSGFTAQMWAATDAQTSSFNNSLQNWQVVPIQDSSGNLTQTVLPNIPANGAAYFSSTAVSAPRIALQFVNTTSGCATTNIELSAVISTVSVTSPLISANSPSVFNGTAANQVQGIVAQQANGAQVNPIMSGGVQLPINTALLNAGIDNFNAGFVGVPSNSSGLFTVNSSPGPAKANELAISIEGAANDNISSNIVSPWVCTTPAGGCNNAGGQTTSSFMKNPKAGQPFQRTFTQASVNAGQDLDAIVLYSSPTATVRQAVQGNATVSATLANGSSILAAATCSITLCNFNTPTDTQGNTYVLLSAQKFSNGLFTSSLWVWASSTLSVAGANTITFVATSGTITSSEEIEVSGISTASLSTPSITSQFDPTGANVMRLDAQFPNQFVCNVTLSTATTSQCQQPPTLIYNTQVRAYVTDVQYNTTVAGAGSTLQLKTGTGSNCGTGTTNLSGILYSGAAVALQNSIGFRTPLIAPLQSAVCVQQVGATPSTTTVEIHGYFAP